MAQVWVSGMRRGGGKDGVRLIRSDVGIDVGECRILWARHYCCALFVINPANRRYWLLKSIIGQVTAYGVRCRVQKQVIRS